MEKSSYRFLVVRDGDFLAVGMLRDWPGGNESALRHLEGTYPDWIQITIQKTDETTTERRKPERDQSGLPESIADCQGIGKSDGRAARAAR